MQLDEDTLDYITQKTYNEFIKIRNILNITPIKGDFICLREASELADISHGSVDVDYAMKEQEISLMKNLDREDMTIKIAYAFAGGVALIVVAYMVIQSI